LADVQEFKLSNKDGKFLRDDEALPPVVMKLTRPK
jgi:hypothetical protein